MTSYRTEQDWDYFFVEARPAGTDDWTTLRDENGNTTQDTGASCPEGWHDLHPQLAHYQGAACEPFGSSGAWHAATGSSNGWQQWRVDLAPFLGQQVEVSIAAVSDWSIQGLGAFVDDLRVTRNGLPVAATSFEGPELGGWVVAGPPPGTTRNANDWIASLRAFEEGAGVTTPDTVYTGFGAEGLTTQEMRTDFLRRAMKHLLG